jgi:hypothetical protein
LVELHQQGIDRQALHPLVGALHGLLIPLPSGWQRSSTVGFRSPICSKEWRVRWLMLGLFLDFLSRQALTAEQGPVSYTEAMATEDEELLAGVTVDAADEQLGA